MYYNILILKLPIFCKIISNVLDQSLNSLKKNPNKLNKKFDCYNIKDN
jgi:hypothetical protein